MTNMKSLDQSHFYQLTTEYIEDIQKFLLNMSFISRVKWTQYLYFMSGEEIGNTKSCFPNIYAIKSCFP